MPTYEFECERCGLKFERRHSIAEEPVIDCPACGGPTRRLVSGGAGFIVRGGGREQGAPRGGECSLEETGTTCCGRTARCGKPPCGEKP